MQPVPRRKTEREAFKAAFESIRGLMYSAGFFSMFVNLLMLTGPLFMLQIYDRVLSSGSVDTLIALTILVAGLYACMGALEYVRGRQLSTAGARVQARLDGIVFRGALDRAVIPAERSRPSGALKDLESIQQFLAGPGPFAFFDAPWTPIYIAAIFIFHSYMGWFAVFAVVLLGVIALLNQFTTAPLEQEARGSQAVSEKMSEAYRREAEAVRALGMGGNMQRRWSQQRGEALEKSMKHSGWGGFFQAFSKTFRLFLQSAILALGAWLAVDGQINPGEMIAGSILLGRALAPVDQAIAHWRGFLRARQGKKSLEEFMSQLPQQDPKTALPEPQAKVDVIGLAISPPMSQTVLLRDIKFTVAPGEAVGVIGASGCGKSSLARVLAGIWPQRAGEVRLDGAAYDQWPPEALGQRIGYLPQDVALFAGTIAENISRFAEKPDEGAIVEAAKRAGVHEMILKQPNGYDTELGDGGAPLSGGERQRVALARALFGDPALLVFDEPNSNLDAAGENALLQALLGAKKRGKAVVIMAHRPSALGACDNLLMLGGGTQQMFGEREEVLKKVTRNHSQITPLRRPAQQGGAAQPAQPAIGGQPQGGGKA